MALITEEGELAITSFLPSSSKNVMMNSTRWSVSSMMMPDTALATLFRSAAWGHREGKGIKQVNMSFR